MRERIENVSFVGYARRTTTPRESRCHLFKSGNSFIFVLLNFLAGAGIMRGTSEARAQKL